MCGILGAFARSGTGISQKKVDAALAAIAHRGPDDAGAERYRVDSGEIMLGHTRLAIIDLSSAGHQPMHSRGGRYSIVYNGELYNYKELKDELRAAGHQFSGGSDTEVLLAAWETWGYASLPRFIGMYAFAVLDRNEDKLICVRDPFGIKPFYYAWEEGYFAFASEVDALSELRPSSVRKLNWQRAYDYLVFGNYDNSIDSMLDGVNHLQPGTYIELDLGKGVLQAPQTFWAPSIEEKRGISFEEATHRVRELFLDDVRLHMRSDVQIGAALSGGVDSSAVVCAMRYVEPDAPIHTFTYDDPDSSLSEAAWADMVNKRVGAIPHTVSVSEGELRNDLARLIRAQGEPFGSTSIYAQFRIFQAAKAQGIKVVLEGQGADEIFAGYHGYPGPYLASMLEKGNVGSALKFLNAWGKWPGRSRVDAIKGLGRLLLPSSLATKAKGWVGHSASPAWLNSEGARRHGVACAFNLAPQQHSKYGRRQVAALVHALTQHGVPHLLRHGDRNAMYFGIENRVPFLTPRMAEFALSLPEHYLMSKQGETKHVFRAAMRGIVPDEILDRKDKIGFETPQANWLPKIFVEELKNNWTPEIGNLLRLDRILACNDAQPAYSSPAAWRILNFTIWVREFNVRLAV